MKSALLRYPTWQQVADEIEQELQNSLEREVDSTVIG